jgi:transposase
MRTPTHKIHLSAEERSFLENMIRTGKESARTIARARILLLSDRSLGHKRKDAEVAQAVMVHKQTVLNIRQRFAKEGTESALYERPRPGQAPKITGEVEAMLTALACSNPPEGNAKWTLKLLADKLVELELVDSISTVAVHKHIKKCSKTLAGKLMVHRHTIS